MKNFARVTAMALAPGVLAAQTATTTIPAEGGDVVVTAIMHASVQVEHAGTVIQVDPALGDFSQAKPADLILITDVHEDHLSPPTVAKVRKPGAPVVAPAAVQKEAGDKLPPPVEVLANGQSKTVAGVSVQAVPMYNLQRGPAAGQVFHDKGRGNGYIVTLGGKRLYFAGDTECTPEMKALKNIDVAFIPMNLPYTMPPAEAAACAKAFKPKIAIPYHFQGQNPDDFRAALQGTGIEVRMLSFY